MSVIYGNPIITNGGGVKLNIDYGATPPTDTTKLWVPLATKPSAVECSPVLDYGDDIFVSQPYTAIPNEQKVSSSFANVGSSVYIIGGSNSNSTTAVQSKNISCYNVLSGSLITKTAKLPMPLSATFCAAIGTKIYIFGGREVVNIYQGIYNYNTNVYCYDTVADTIETLSVKLPKTMCARNNPYNNTLTVLECTTRIKRINLTTFEHSDIYQSGADMKSSYQWSLTNDGETAFLAWASWGNASSSTNYSSKTLRFNLLDTNINPVVVSEQKPGNGTSRLFQEAHLGNIYSCLDDTLYTIPYKRDLASGDLAITADVSRDGIDILADKNNSIFINPISVYLGDENSVAQKVDAYLYDNADGKWKTLDGVSYTADMLNALNIMGVN